MILEDPFMKLVEKVRRHARKDVAVWEVDPEGVDRTETLVDIFIGFSHRVTVGRGSPVSLFALVKLNAG